MSEPRAFYVQSWGRFKFVYDRRKANRMARRGKHYHEDIRWCVPKPLKRKQLLHNGRKSHA